MTLIDTPPGINAKETRWSPCVDFEDLPELSDFSKSGLHEGIDHAGVYFTDLSDKVYVIIGDSNVPN